MQQPCSDSLLQPYHTHPHPPILHIVWGHRTKDNLLGSSISRRARDTCSLHISRRMDCGIPSSPIFAPSSLFIGTSLCRILEHGFILGGAENGLRTDAGEAASYAHWEPVASVRLKGMLASVKVSWRYGFPGCLVPGAAAASTACINRMGERVAAPSCQTIQKYLSDEWHQSGTARGSSHLWMGSLIYLIRMSLLATGFIVFVLLLQAATG